MQTEQPYGRHPDTQDAWLPRVLSVAVCYHDSFCPSRWGDLRRVWQASQGSARAGKCTAGRGRAGYLRGRVTEEALRSPEVWAPPSKSLQDVAGRCRGRHRSSLSPRVRMRLHFGSSFFPWNFSYLNIPCVSSIHFLSFHTLVDFFKAPAGSYQSVKWNAPFNLADGKLCILTSMPQTALWRANSGSAHEPVPSSQLNKGRECQGEVFAEKS